MKNLCSKTCPIVFLAALLDVAGCGPVAPDPESTDQVVLGLSDSYAGFDQEVYPKDPTMSWLRTKTNLSWVGFYLGPSPDHSDKSWMNTRKTLLTMGWGFAPIYVGRQAGWSALNRTQGGLDALNAASLAREASFPAGAVVYLDIEQGGMLAPDLVDYYRGWVDGIVNAGYSPGVYCSYSHTADQLKQADNRSTVWVFNLSHYSCPAKGTTQFPKPDPAGGYAAAAAWQLVQDGPSGHCSITIDGGKSLGVDLSSANRADPSTPVVPLVPALTVPNGDAVISGTLVPMSWSAPTALRANVQVYYWNGRAWTYYQQLSTTNSMMSVGGLVKGRHYAWYVQGCNVAGCSSWSNPSTFYY